MTQLLNYVEIDVPHCSLTYSVPPCQATLGGSTVVKAINSGGDAVSTGGINYEADTSGSPNSLASGSDNNTVSTGDGISGTTDDIIYQTERWGTFGYEIPLANGEYSVTLKFAEIFFGDNGERIFDVQIEGATVIDDLDIFSQVGHDAALDYTFNVTISDGVLDIDFSASVDNAKIGGVVVSSLGGGGTGTRKCFNSLGTCQDPENFTDEPVTLRFSEDAGFLPANIYAFPFIKEIDFDPAMLDLGSSLGQRATLKIKFSDHPHSDAGPDFDKYPETRAYNPYEQGTFWGKFRARNPFLRGRSLRLIRGSTDQEYAEMEVRHYVVESYDGPTADGIFTIIAKDVLKLADKDRAQAPSLNTGLLSSDFADSPFGTIAVSPVSAISEYSAGGYLNIGGNEIVSFARASQIKLLLSAEGLADNTEAVLDDSIYRHQMTVTAEIDDDRAPKFGQSIDFDGTNDDVRVTTPGTNFTYGTGDFTIDFWVMFDVLNVLRTLVDHRPLATNGLYPTIRKNSSNQLEYFTDSSVRITGTTTLTTATWYHVALTRSGTSTKLFLNGVQEGSTYTDSNNYINGGNGRPIFGASGVDPTQEELDGGMDDIRVIKGGAVWTANFTPPTQPHEPFLVGFVDTSDTNIYVLERAQLGTSLQTHSAGDRLQEVLRYEAQSPADIIYDLLVNEAGVSALYITLANWQTEIDTYLDQVYSATIAEPTGVADLISELMQQAALSIWWDDQEQQIKLRVLNAIPISHSFNDDNIIAASFEITEQPDKRISQVWTYFDLQNPLESQDRVNNYRSVAKTVDIDAEVNHGSAAIKKIFSRWITTGGAATAQRLNNFLLAQYVNPPRRFNFSLMRVGIPTVPSLGSGILVDAWPLQDDVGARLPTQCQITKIAPGDAEIEVEAEEQLFDIALDSPGVHNIILDSNINNVNLETLHDALFNSAVSGDEINCTVLDGVIIGALSNSVPAFTVGSFVAGVTVNLIVLGRIQGCGGGGGDGRVTSGGGAASGRRGSDGGIALYTRRAINLTSTNGEIWGGGGGGGSGPNASAVPGGGGGGGAGTQPGSGGVAGTHDGSSGSAQPGLSGTSEIGGIGGTATGSRDGGDGGDPGLPGTDGEDQPSFIGGRGGDAGAAIDGDSFVTDIGAPGDIRGSQIN